MGFTKVLTGKNSNLSVELHIESDLKKNKAIYNGKEYSATNKNLKELFTDSEIDQEVEVLTELVFRFILAHHYDLIETPSFDLDEKVIKPQLNGDILQFYVTQSGAQHPIPYQVHFPLSGGNLKINKL